MLQQALRRSPIKFSYEIQNFMEDIHKMVPKLIQILPSYLGKRVVLPGLFDIFTSFKTFLKDLGSLELLCYFWPLNTVPVV